MKNIMTKLLGECRELFRFWSVQLAALGGLVVAYFMSDPTLLPRMVALVPEEYRPVAAALVGFVAFALPTLARRLPQPNLPKKDGAQ